MSAEMKQCIQQIVDRIVQAAQPEQIIVFGSYARGEAQAGSDLDLLVIESEPFGPARSRYREMARLERAVGEVPVPTDILVFARDEVESLRNCLNHVVARALTEGRILYARS